MFGPERSPIIFVGGPYDRSFCTREGCQPVRDGAHLRCAPAPVLRVVHEQTQQLASRFSPGLFVWKEQAAGG